MSQLTCLRRTALEKCLYSPNRPINQPPFAIPHALPFSTSAALDQPASPFNAKRGGKVLHARGVRQLRIKRPKRVETVRRAQPGERRALKRRIVLSNTNALEVAGLQGLTVENMLDPELQGKMAALPGPVVDSLRAVEAFKPRQGWGMFRRPAAVVRKETMELAMSIDEVENADRKETVRRVIVGERGCGKSTLLLQAMSMAFLKGWVVVNIPDGKALTEGESDYAPLRDTNPTQYAQPQYISHLLSQIAKANATVLSTLQLTPNHTHDLPIPIQPNMTLHRLAALGGQDSSIAWPIFLALWTELTAPSRPPLLLAFDTLHHLMRPTAYMAPSCNPVHAHDLALLAHLLPYLSGARSLRNGGLVLAATSGSEMPRAPALELAIAQSEARAAGLSPNAPPLAKDDGTPVDTRAGPLARLLDSYSKEPPPPPRFPHPNPFVKHDVRVLETMANVPVLRLRGLDRAEARAVLDYYAASGLLRGVVNEQVLGEKWTLAGGGVVGELEKAAVRMRV